MPPKAHHNFNSGNGLTLRTLGATALWREGDTTPLLGPGKPVALLTYLASTPARTASRDHLVELLWADADPERARHALRQTLWQLRGVLGDAAIVGKEEITLALDLPSDRATFLALIEADRLEEAVALYAGPFFPAFASAGGAAFEHWADVERERLRTMFVRAVDRLARRQLAEGNPRATLASARRLLTETGEPIIGHRLAIEAHLALGDMISAADEADALERWATEEAMPLDTAARASIQRARTQTASRAEGDAEAPKSVQQWVGELVGREEQFATALAAWQAVREGRSRHIHLVAPAGLGKTRLLRELESRLHHSGAQVRYLRAHPGDRTLPGARLGELARCLASLPGAKTVAPEVAATLVALDPALANHYPVAADPSTGAEAQRRRILALAELARAISEEGPYAILLDDLHWADDESVATLQSLLTRQEGTRYLLVSATRPTAGQPLRSEGRTTLALAPLTAEQIAQMLDSIATRDQRLADLPAALHAATSGTPLLLLELIQLARERGALSIDHGQWSSHDPGVLAMLLRSGEGLRQRLARLGPESRELMRLLALAGHPLGATILAAAAEMTPAVATERLHLLERQGFVQPVGNEWEPAHDELGEAALAGEEDAEARRRLALAMERNADDSPTALSRIMQHWRALDDVSGMTRVVVRAVARERQIGRPFAPEAVVTALLAGAPDERVLRRVMGALPAALRWRRRLPALAVAATLLLVVGARGLANALNRPELVVGVAWYDQQGERVEAVVPVDRSTWNRDTPLEAVPRASPLLRHLGAQGSEYDVRYTASGDSAVTTMRRPGTSNLEIVLLTTGTLIWLTDSERDDIAPSFAPDGSSVVFLSSRWSQPGDDASDVAVIDLRTRQVRQVTSTRHIDHRPAPSPDGTRIGFVRNSVDEGGMILCSVQWDGSATSCLPMAGLELVDVIGWVDDNHLLLSARRGGTGIVARVDMRSGDWTMIVENVAQRLALDAAHGVLACLCEDPDTRRMGVRIGRLDGNGEWRSVALPAGARTDRIEILQSGESSRAIARLVVTPPGPLAVGTSYRLRAVALSQDGNAVAFDSTTLRWSSDAPDLVAINAATGVATPLREGHTTIRVTAGGWRGDAVAVTVQPSRAELAHDETWTEGGSGWRLFGDPLPLLATHPALGPALHVNGDGVFSSGAYFRAPIAADHGITVEVELSTPINRDKWQTVSVGLSPASDAALLASWDHHSSFAPGTRIREGSDCGLGVPGGEGPVGRERLAITAGGRYDMAAFAASLRSGTPYRVRVMVGADGRCHVALNDVPIHVSSNLLQTDLPLRLWIQGNSVGTDIAVGRVRIWKGDPGGVDWGSR